MKSIPFGIAAIMVCAIVVLATSYNVKKAAGLGAGKRGTQTFRPTRRSALAVAIWRSAAAALSGG